MSPNLVNKNLATDEDIVSPARQTVNHDGKRKPTAAGIHQLGPASGIPLCSTARTDDRYAGIDLAVLGPHRKRPTVIQAWTQTGVEEVRGAGLA
jgi:hypothetical protein